MARLDYTCKICQRPGYVLMPAIEKHDDVEVFQRAVDKFVPMLTCNRCWDWRDRASRLCSQMATLCRKLETSRSYKPETRKKIEGAIRESMNNVCHRFLTNNSDYTGCDGEGAGDLAARCFERPDVSVTTMRQDYRMRIDALEQEMAAKKAESRTT